MLRIYISSLLILLSCTAFAFNPIDSIGVTSINGKKVIIHKIENKETYYGLGQKYNVDYREIIKFNKNTVLKKDAVIQIPTNTPFFGNENNIIQPPRIVEKGNHTVQRGESLFGISRQYGMSVEELKRVNNLNSNQLRPGQILRVGKKEVAGSTPPTQSQTPQITTVPPTDNHNETPSTTAAPVSVPSSKIVTNVEEKSQTIPGKENKKNQPQVIMHRVASDETLYSIATRFKTTMNKLIEDNNIKNYQIRMGQVLYINGNKSAYETQNNSVDEENEGVTTITDPKLRKDPSVYGLSQVEEKGSAMWIDDKDLDNTKMLVLHKTAPVGTIIRITNPLNNRSTFAKVVGSYSENEATKNIIILITKAVANSIGAIDKKFYCNINYGIPAAEDTNE